MTSLFKQPSAWILAICCLGATSKAALVYTDIPDAGVFGVSGDAFFNVDLNQDGTDDFVFRSNFAPGEGFVVLPQGTNQVFSTLVQPPDISTFAIDFDHGTIIGPSVLGDSSVTLIGLRFAPGGEELGPGLLSCALFSELVCLGQFDSDEQLSGGDQTDFVGVALELGDGTHFGYVEVLSSGFNGGTIVSFAFESEPNTPIIAGAVPEPSLRLLALLGGFVFLFRRRRSCGSSSRAWS